MSAAAQPVHSSASVSQAAAQAHPVPSIQRYFEVSLFLLVATGIMAIVSTGKLDVIAFVVPPVALVWKGYRLWRGKGPEISVRFATELVLAYFLFFPLDLFFLSRSLADNAPNPALYSALLAAVHLLLFASLVRLYSARTNRDYAEGGFRLDFGVHVLAFEESHLSRGDSACMLNPVRRRAIESGGSSSTVTTGTVAGQTVGSEVECGRNGARPGIGLRRVVGRWGEILHFVQDGSGRWG